MARTTAILSWFCAPIASMKTSRLWAVATRRRTQHDVQAAQVEKCAGLPSVGKAKPMAVPNAGAEETMKTQVLGIAAVLLLANSQCMADDLKVLSAGAMQRGLVTVAAKFKEHSGNQIQIRYATAPELRKILTENGAAADVILAPNPTLAELAGAGKL